MKFKVLTYLILFSQVLFSGAWTQKRGRAFVSMYYYFYYASKYFDNNYNLKNFGANAYFYSNNFGLYIEYGIHDKVNFVLNQPFMFNRWSDSLVTLSNRGFGDGELGLKINIFMRKLVFSIQGVFVYPYLYSLKKEPPLGSGITGGALKLLFGYATFVKLRKFEFNLELGYRSYLERVSDQIRGIVAMAFEISKILKFYLQIDAVNSLKRFTFQLTKNPMLSKDLVELKISPAVILMVSYYVYMQAGAYLDLYGRNLSQGKGFFVSFWIYI